MKVLVVPKWYPWPDRPVFGAFCREHARALATRHDVVVLPSLAIPRPGFAAFSLEDAVEDGIRTLRVRYRRPFLRPAAMGFQLLGMLAARRRLRREGWRPDIVHAHVFEAAPPALALGRLDRAPVVVTEHYTGFQRGLVTGYDRTLARLSFEHADLVAPVSAELAGRLRALAPRAAFEIVPNVVDTAEFAPAPAPVAARGGARLLNVAALAEKKGHRYLLEALAELPDATLEIVGDGELRGELERRARALGVDDRVRFLGERPKHEVAELMRAADAFVLPSLAENLPVVLIEAQASGLPAVATDVGGVSELVDEAAGALVSPADPAALAGAIRATLARRLDSAALAARARERYGYDAVAARWTAIYDGLSRRRRRASGG
ncbi:MAG TPA: glycosyltransferase [Solirubrobacteraceae bacterium]|nr:glycosyltransferase [Solirubrobacteraceae bacterium]